MPRGPPSIHALAYDDNTHIHAHTHGYACARACSPYKARCVIGQSARALAAARATRAVAKRRGLGGGGEQAKVKGCRKNKVLWNSLTAGVKAGRRMAAPRWLAGRSASLAHTMTSAGAAYREEKRLAGTVFVLTFASGSLSSHPPPSLPSIGSPRQPERTVAGHVVARWCHATDLPSDLPARWFASRLGWAGFFFFWSIILLVWLFTPTCDCCLRPTARTKIKGTKGRKWKSYISDGNRCRAGCSL